MDLPVVKSLPDNNGSSTGAAEERGLQTAGIHVCPIEGGYHWEGGLEERGRVIKKGVSLHEKSVGSLVASLPWF